MNEFELFDQFFEDKGPEDLQRFVDKNVDIVHQVIQLLRDKGWSQSDLARKMGKSDAEVSKWLSGTHNLTLRSIARLETALEADIILTPLKAEEKFVVTKWRAEYPDRAQVQQVVWQTPGEKSHFPTHPGIQAA